MRVSTLLASLATLALFDVALAGKHTGSSWARRHHGHHGHSTNEDGSSGYGSATSDVQKVSGREFELSKRYDNSRFSFYDAGLGACGKVNSGSDFVRTLFAWLSQDMSLTCFLQIVALNSAVRWFFSTESNAQC